MQASCKAMVFSRTVLVGWRRGLCSQSVRGNSGPPGRYWRPAAFTLVVGVTSYGVSAVCAEEQRSRWIKQYVHPRKQRDGIVQKFRRWWLHFGAADRFVFTIIALNTGVFLLWRVPGMQRVLEKNFLSKATHRSHLHLLLSEFSHLEVWHLALNMLVLWSFAPTFLRTVGDAASSFSAWPYYLTAGTFASMVGHYSKLAKRTPIGSLGASGALMAVVSLVVLNHPNATVYLIFLPFIPIPASWALAGVVTIDLLGVLRGWQFFDHAGHLGGVLFAGLYQFWLHRVLSESQSKVARTWRRLRSQNSSTGKN